MKNVKMDKEETEISFQEQKIDLIRLRIQNGFYDNNSVLENVVKSILKNGLKN
jgi:anti-sigma28 factor (negative regulator of flagellin synthesis)